MGIGDWGLGIGDWYLRAATASLQSINSSMTLDTKSINPKTIVIKKSK